MEGESTLYMDYDKKESVGEGVILVKVKLAGHD